MLNQVGRDAAVNSMGMILPALAGLLAMPVLLHNIGEARLGVFTLALGVIGLTGLLDFGVARGITQFLASQSDGETKQAAVSVTLRRSLVALAAIGLILSACLWLVADPITVKLFRLPDELCSQTSQGLKWIGLSIPFALISMAAAGILEGRRDFLKVNAIRAPLNVLTFIVPMVLSFWTSHLGHLIAALGITRVLGSFVWMWAIRDENIFFAAGGQGSHLSRILKFSSWLSVSNIIGPLMIYTDRFYLASLYPPATVALFTVPFDASFRATSLPVAAMNAVFPALSSRGLSADVREAIMLSAGKMLFLLWLPPLFLAVLYADKILSVWLNPSFGENATTVFQLILIGVFLNGFAHIPVAGLHAAGRSDITAKIHAAELPFYLIIMISAINTWGLHGAAVAWLVRISVDTALMYVAEYTTCVNAARGKLVVLGGCFSAAACMLLLVVFQAVLNRGVVVTISAAILVPSSLILFRSLRQEALKLR